MRQHLYTFFCFLLLLSATTACTKKDPDPTPVAATTPVTLDNYDRITVGMSYTQVVAILGQGTLVSTGEYTWSADNSNTIVITVIFANNLVQSKSQVGLASPTSTGGTTTGGCPSTYNGHTVYTGPRGGCYYINSNGNKTYI